MTPWPTVSIPRSRSTSRPSTSWTRKASQVIQARLAERLGHSAPAVSEMIRRLKAEGYVTVEDR